MLKKKYQLEKLREQDVGPFEQEEAAKMRQDPTQSELADYAIRIKQNEKGERYWGENVGALSPGEMQANIRRDEQRLQELMNMHDETRELFENLDGEDQRKADFAAKKAQLISRKPGEKM